MSGILHRVGFMIRETGQALDRLGCRLQGSNVFLEDGRAAKLATSMFVKGSQNRSQLSLMRLHDINHHSHKALQGNGCPV